MVKLLFVLMNEYRLWALPQALAALERRYPGAVEGRVYSVREINADAGLERALLADGAAADMALAGIASRIPPDEVVDALINVQGLLHPDLRGNLRGGLASTATGRALKDEWYARMKRMQA